jgi:diguanylate cyclase (GGDEF)-like protein
MLQAVSAAAKHRQLLTGCAVLAYALVFAAFVLIERPGLGIGHFFYLPICLIALAHGARAGAGAAIVAAALYAVAIVLAPRVPAGDALTVATLLRVVTFGGIGILVGRFASANRDLVDRLQDLADRDYLTGLANSRWFDSELATRCASDTPFVLVLGDMDNLKEINDAHGHDAGNKAIALVAEALTRNAADGDHVARVGGDEFALVTDVDAAEAIAICSRVASTLAVEGIRVSFGWAACPAHGRGAVELFRKADDRLYAAKLVARNRTHIAALAAVPAT